MTREDVAKLIRMNFVLYKLGSKPLTDEEMQTTIDVWAYQFGDYDGDTVKRAFLAANRVCVYPVTVADIDDIADDSKKGDEFAAGLELDADGKVKDAEKQLSSIKTTWGGKIATTKTTGAKVDTPPTSYAGTSPEDFKKMSLDDRIKLKNSNPELYQQLRAK